MPQPRVHVRAGAGIGMEPSAAALETGAPPRGERAEAAGPVLGAGAAQGPAAQEGAASATCGGGRGSEGEEDLPLRLLLGRGRRRAGPGTPAPSWKVEASPEEGEAAAAAPVPPAVAAARRSSASASARQLGASLWEIHDVMREGRRSGARRHRSGGEDGGGVVVDQQMDQILKRSTLQTKQCLVHVALVGILQIHRWIIISCIKKEVIHHNLFLLQVIQSKLGGRR